MCTGLNKPVLIPIGFQLVQKLVTYHPKPPASEDKRGNNGSLIYAQLTPFGLVPSLQPKGVRKLVAGCFHNLFYSGSEAQLDGKDIRIIVFTRLALSA